jgi:hypothetical protein
MWKQLMLGAVHGAGTDFCQGTVPAEEAVSMERMDPSVEACTKSLCLSEAVESFCPLFGRFDFFSTERIFF